MRKLDLLDLAYLAMMVCGAVLAVTLGWYAAAAADPSPTSWTAPDHTIEDIGDHTFSS